MKNLIVLLIVLLVFGSFIGCKNRRNSDVTLLEYGISPPGKGDEGGGNGGGGGQQPVPEPSTMLIMGAGIVGIALRSRNKRKKK